MSTDTDRAVCGICKGAKLDVDDKTCWSCLGTGTERTRDELAEGVELTDLERYLYDRVRFIKPPRKALFISGNEYEAGWHLQSLGLARLNVASLEHKTAFLFPMEPTPDDETDRRDEADDVTVYSSHTQTNQ